MCYVTYIATKTCVNRKVLLLKTDIKCGKIIEYYYSFIMYAKFVRKKLLHQYVYL